MFIIKSGKIFFYKDNKFKLKNNNLKIPSIQGN